MKTDDKIQRSVSPIPDVPRVDFTTYDAKDPETNFPPPTAAGSRRSPLPRAGLQLGASEYHVAVGVNAEARGLLHRAVW